MNSSSSQGQPGAGQGPNARGVPFPVPSPNPDDLKGLRDRVAQLEKLIAAVPSIVYTFRLWPDGSMSLPYAGPRIREIFGVESRELEQDAAPALALIHPDHADRVRQSILESASRMTPWREEFVVRNPDRGDIWVEGFSVPERQSDGSTLWHGFVGDVTDRKQVEDRLRESDDRFHLLARATSDAIWDWNLRTNRIWHSENVEVLFGWKIKDSDLSWWSERLHPDDRGRVNKHFMEVVHGKELHWEDEYRFRCADGSYADVHDRGLIIRDAQGRASRMLGSMMDVTIRKQSEVALRQSEERLHKLMENLSEGLVLARLDGQLIHWNPAALEMHGFTSSQEWCRRLPEFAKMFEFSTLDGAVIPLEQWPMARIIRGERLRDCELRIRRLDVDWERICNYSGTVFSDTSGQRVAFLTIRDFTKRKRAEAALRDSQETFSKAFQLSPVPIAISTEAEGRYLDVNDAFLKMVGYDRDEIVGVTAAQLGIWVTLEDRVEMVRRLMETPGPQKPIQTQFRTKSGNLRIGDVSAERIQVRGVPCLLVIVHDITEERHLEDQFRQAQKMEAIGRLAGGVAHDFNNILGVIVGYSELAHEKLDQDPTVRTYIEQIKKAGDRAAGLTRQLLAFSRQQVLQPRLLSLNSVVLNVSKMLTRLIGEDVSLSLRPGAALDNIKADLGQVEQILMNLVVNSRDALPRGGKITIETANIHLDDDYVAQFPSARPGAYVMLSVADDGCGMDASTKSRIFEPFFTTKKLGEGTGLGLSTVYGIVEQSGGHIVVESEPNHGTTFKIYFPQVERSDEEIATADTESAPLRGAETILLVEDDENLRALTAQLLESGGYTVLHADGPDSAIKTARHYDKNIDLLLTDVIMPIMRGNELADLLRTVRSGLKVLHMSGYAGDPTGQQWALDPSTALLEKPFTKASLLAKVRSVLDA